MSDKLSNYIPISRKLFDHPFFTEQRTFSKFEAWIDLLQEARYDQKDGSRMIKNKVVTFSRGEIPASLRFLAERWNWSKNKVDSFIQLLEDEGMIKKRTAKGTSQTIITICKYKDYNSIQKIEGQQKGHDRDSTGTAPGQNSNIVNKENNVVGPPQPPPSIPDFVPRFANVERFVRPTIEEVKFYFAQQGKKEDLAVRFFNYYDGLDWMKGNTRIVNWRSFALNWEDNEQQSAPKANEDQFNKTIYG